MPNQNHRLPVGKAQPIMMHIQSATGETYTTALFKASDVPEGTELYATPSDSRLSLEVEVANDNAQHWQQALDKANVNRAELRTELHRCRSILRAVNLLLVGKDIDFLSIEAGANAKKLLDLIDKELG